MNIILNEKGLIAIGVVMAIIYVNGYLDGIKDEQNRKEKESKRVKWLALFLFEDYEVFDFYGLYCWSKSYKRLQNCETKRYVERQRS